MMPPLDVPPPRYRPDLPLPPYTYVPGRAPHPMSDVAGHSYGRTHEPAAPIDDDNWSTHDVFLHAVDLFNYGYYWESHEAWEAVWHAVGRHGPTADLLKGLIKLAAAGVKVREGRPTGVVTHARRAAELFGSVRSTGVEFALGLSISDLLASCATLSAQPPQLDTDPTDVRPLKGLRLVLRPN